MSRDYAAPRFFLKDHTKETYQGDIPGRHARDTYQGNPQGEENMLLMICGRWWRSRRSLNIVEWMELLLDWLHL